MPPEGYVNPRSARGNTGCWSCRFRKKKCQRSDTNNPICDDCQRFNMECIGMGDERPRRPGLSKLARAVLRDWIKRHTKETPDPNEAPLSISYLWDAPSTSHPSHPPSHRRSVSASHEARRSSDSTTYTLSNHSRSVSAGSSDPGGYLGVTTSLLAGNSYSGTPSASSSTSQTGSYRSGAVYSATSAPMLNVAQSAQFGTYGQPVPHSNLYSRLNPSPPQQSYATTQVVQNTSATQPSYLSVPNLHIHAAQLQQQQQQQQQQPNFNFLITGDTLNSNTSNAPAVPWIITDPALNSQYTSTSTISSPLFLSPGSPYASSILSSSSSMDDGLWGDQGPPSPSYYDNELYIESSQGSSVSGGTASQPTYIQPQPQPQTHLQPQHQYYH